VLVLVLIVPLTVTIGAGWLLPEVPKGLAVLGVVFVGMLYVSIVAVSQLIADSVGARIAEEALSAQTSGANARLVHRATHDDLTGLANRALFHDTLEHQLARAHIGRTAVLYLDIDRFKVVNDSLGHIEGDQLLHDVAERLRQSVRSEDLLARLGGDEFTVVAPGLDPGGAQRLGERIRTPLDAPFTIGGLRVVTTISVGIALSRTSTSALDLMHCADAALYEAKGARRNRVVLVDDSMRSSLSNRLKRENALRRALDNHDFEAWCQPLLDPHTREIVAVEALATSSTSSSRIRPAHCVGSCRAPLRSVSASSSM